jgi:hypothetical protein
MRRPFLLLLPFAITPNDCRCLYCYCDERIDKHLIVAADRNDVACYRLHFLDQRAGFIIITVVIAIATGSGGSGSSATALLLYMEIIVALSSWRPPQRRQPTTLGFETLLLE